MSITVYSLPLFPFGLPPASEFEPLDEPGLLPVPSLPLFGFEPLLLSAESPEPEESDSPDVSVDDEESVSLEVSESDEEFDELEESWSEDEPLSSESEP